MTDEVNIFKWLAGGFLTLIGWQTRQNSKDIKEFPEKYVMKADQYVQSQNILEEIRGIRTDMKSGQERIHDRIDDVHTRINEKEEK